MQDALTRAVAVLVEHEELHQVDSVLGRYLAALPAWTPDQGRAAMRMVSKYVARLRGYGISAGDLQSVMGGDDGLSGGGNGVAQTSVRPNGVWAQEAARRVGVNCTAFTVRFPKDRDLIAAVQVLPASRWDPKAGVWRVPFNVAAAEQLFSFALTYGFALEPEVFAKVDEITGAAEEAAQASREEAAEYVVADVHKTLRPYQQAGVRYLVEVAKGRALLCDEMGLGKTVESLAAVRKLEAWPLLVICPASLKYNWQREAKDVLGVNAQVLPDAVLGSSTACVFRPVKKSKAFELVEPNEYNTSLVRGKMLIIHYDLLPVYLGFLKAVKWGAVIIDESHYIKEPNAVRTKAVRMIMRRVPVRFLLTGTPVVNQISDLLPQLSAIGKLDELGGFWHFAERYCEAKKKKVSGHGDNERFIWDMSGRANARELHERLRATCFLRRLKKNVLAELPPKVRATVPIVLDNFAEYRRAEGDVVQFLARRAAQDKEFLAGIAHLPDAKRFELIEARHLSKVEQLADAEALVRFEALKQLAVKGKLAAAKDWIATFLESGEKLCVFAEHVDVVKGLAVHFKAPCIMGDTSPKARQVIVDRFQNDSECRLLVCNIKAGGVGLTLTAASNCAFLELPWTSMAVDQAEDRFHRFGQRRSVTCYYLMGKQTVDWQIYGIIRGKRELANAAVDGEGGEEVGQRNTLRTLARDFLEPGML